MKRSLNKRLIKKAQQHLKSTDKILSPLIEKYGPCTIVPALDNPFHALASSIISQQLSARAARAIKSRLFDLLGTDRLTPKGILKIPAQGFKSIGLSRAKSGYIRGLAWAVKNGAVNFSSLSSYEDEDVITRLTTLSGIGRWTAEMFLIFGLGRPDVLSLSDAGLRRAFRLAYHLPDVPSVDEMILISEAWKPYRSVASWYLWRTVD